MNYLTNKRTKSSTSLWKVKVPGTNHWVTFVTVDGEDFTKALWAASNSCSKILSMFKQSIGDEFRRFEATINAITDLRNALNPLDFSQLEFVRIGVNDKFASNTKAGAYSHNLIVGNAF